MPGSIIGVTDGDKILMSKYAGRAYKKYALLAGFTEIGETIEETVQREVMEEVGLKVKNIRYYKSQPWSFSDTDPDGVLLRPGWRGRNYTRPRRIWPCRMVPKG